eukprot:SM000124S25933  [mRNA]  locus=s124:161079:161591:- [translate_table: standard]
MGGLFAVVLLILIFPPLACIPCCMPSCYDRHQRPVYGYTQQPQATAVAFAQPQAPLHVAYGVPVANYA